MFCAAAKDTSLKPLSFVFSCRLCFPTVVPKVPSLPTFALNSLVLVSTFISDLGHQNFEKGILGCVMLVVGTYKANVKIFCLGWRLGVLQLQ